MLLKYPNKSENDQPKMTPKEEYHGNKKLDEISDNTPKYRRTRAGRSRGKLSISNISSDHIPIASIKENESRSVTPAPVISQVESPSTYFYEKFFNNNNNERKAVTPLNRNNGVKDKENSPPKAKKM